MNVLSLAWKGLRQRRLATALTAFSTALGVGLVVAVGAVRSGARTAFDDAARGYDVVLSGPKTTALSATMNALFHVDKPVDTMPVEAWLDARKDPRVLHAVPIAVGDVYRGFRVVGTRADLFDAIPDADGRPLRARVAPGGRLFADDGGFEAVVGAYAAARTGLAVGASFTVTHGLEDGGHAHDEQWKVVGVLEPTGTPNDRAVFITLSSFFHVKGHDRPKAPGAPDDHDHDHDEGGMHEGGAAPDDERARLLGDEVWALSTVVVRLKSPAFRFQFAGDWNRRRDCSAAVPSQEIRRLFEIVQGVDGLLRAVGATVLLVAVLSVLASLWNAVQGRRREIALLRALGARRAHVFAVVVLEAVLVCALGGVAGVAFGHVGVAAAAPWLLAEVGIRIATGFLPAAVYGGIAGGLLLLGLVAGALPAWRAYRVPVARHLHPVD